MLIAIQTLTQMPQLAPMWSIFCNIQHSPNNKDNAKYNGQCSEEEEFTISSGKIYNNLKM
jgi:hypothetical protein